MKKNKTNSIIGANPRKKRKAPYIVLGALAIIAGLGCAFYGGYTLGKNAKAADNGGEIVAIKDNQVAIKCAYNAKSGAKYGTYNLTYSVTPTIYTDQIVAKIAYQDGTNVENGIVTLEHDTIKHEVKVNCLKAFAKKIVLTLYADSNPNVKGTMTFDFRERINVILPDSINLVEGQVPTVSPRVDTTGGTVTVDKNVTDVTYSWNPDFLAWVKEKSMKELNDYMTENRANMSFQGETFTEFVGLGAEDATGFFKKAFKAYEFLTTKGGKYTWEEAYSDDDSEDPWSQCSSTWYLGSAAKTDFTSEFDGTKPVFDWTCKVNGVSYAKSFGLTLSSINVTSIALSGSNYCF